jgi:hypothetical protein
MERQQPQHQIKDEEQIARAMAQRAANAEASRRGEPLPYPNIWDVLDPTKLDRNATIEEIHKRYLEFTQLCRSRPKKRHAL